MNILQKLNPGKHDFEFYYPKCRDKNIPVYRCKNTGAIALQTTSSTTSYSEIEDFSYWSTSDRAEAIKKCLRDDKRRQNYIREYNPSLWLDVGSGAGGIFQDMPEEIVGESVEPQPHCRKHMPVACYQSCEDIDSGKMYDLITSFHVVEHLDDPLATLKQMKQHLKEGGKCIVEVPHAKDFLLEHLDSNAFRDFTLWSQHLILHTEETLIWLLEQAGFKILKLEYIQRYPLSNHLYWLRHEKPGGHEVWDILDDHLLNSAYEKKLKDLKMTDTLLVYAE